MISASKKSPNKNPRINSLDADPTDNTGTLCFKLERGNSLKFDNLKMHKLRTHESICASDKLIIGAHKNLKKSNSGKPNNFEVSNSIVNKIVTNEDELVNEKKLYLAILERGIRDYLSANKKYFGSAKEWIDSNASDYPFSFVNICTALGFDKNRLRKKLVELRAVARKNNRNSREIYRILNDLEIAS